MKEIRAVKNPRLSFFIAVFALVIGMFANLAKANAEPTIRFGVLSIAQPARIFDKWTPFVKYLETQLGRPVEIVVPRGFAKMKQAVADQNVDFFYVNSHVYYRLKQEGRAKAVAQMRNISGKVVSQSEIFVRADSKIKNVVDLKGKSIAFVSPMGAGGYLAPRAHLYDQGVDAQLETSEKFTKNLTSSLHQVLLGEVDAGAMCGVNYDLMAKKIDTGELKVIGISGDYPENVIAARSDLSPALIQDFTDTVLNMMQAEAGKQLLHSMRDMKIESFIPYEEGIEQITQSLLEKSHLEK